MEFFPPFTHLFSYSAAHVTMSVLKFLARMGSLDPSENKETSDTFHSAQDPTFGIASDPLTQFAMAISALCHDVGHTGVPNQQLARENPQLVETYGSRSVAEQHSVTLTWQLFMSDAFSDLRQSIHAGYTENFQHFRQVRDTRGNYSSLTVC